MPRQSCKGVTYGWDYKILLLEARSEDLTITKERAHLDKHQVVNADSSKLRELLSTLFQECADSVPFLTLWRAESLGKVVQMDNSKDVRLRISCVHCHPSTST